MFGIMFLLPLILYGCAALLKLGLRVAGQAVPGILTRLAFVLVAVGGYAADVVSGRSVCISWVRTGVTGLGVCGVAGVPLHIGQKRIGGARGRAGAGLGRNGVWI